MRCINAKRQCGGYQNDLVGYRQYGLPGAAKNFSSSMSTARKCTLPKRVPIPGTDILPEDTIPTEITLDESNALALRAFYYDFCVVSTNRNLSRGYLAGLEQMIGRLGPKSDLAKVCQAIACASHGKPGQRPQFVQRAETSYHQLLGSLARTIEESNSVNNAEPRLVAMLLGLYQMVMTNLHDHGAHEIHARGLATLLKIENSPLSLLGPIMTAQNPGLARKHKDLGIFSVPSMSEISPTLDDLLVRLGVLWQRSEESTAPLDVFTLEEECRELDQQFAKWQYFRSPEFRPTTVHKIDLDQGAQRVAVGYWPGKIDTYFDLYVAGVWNIFRAARLILLGLSTTSNGTLGNEGNSMQYIKTTNHIVGDIFASIPYHLADNLPVFVEGIGKNADVDRGRTLGGLLLMHPLYVVSKISFLPDKTREYARDCLRCIGDEMGIGQACLMADDILGKWVYDYMARLS
ncbi:hypothetical protein IFR05_002673 [Cadophora sp. M221]|nr:hypothetical protein IFR05_002673 [Cadophora sp. M221]